jgi:hypothetical protein
LTIQYQTAKAERDSLLITNNDLNKFIDKQQNAIKKSERLIQEMINNDKKIDIKKLTDLGWTLVDPDSTATKPRNKLPK